MVTTLQGKSVLKEFFHGRGDNGVKFSQLGPNLEEQGGVQFNVYKNLKNDFRMKLK